MRKGTLFLAASLWPTSQAYAPRLRKHREIAEIPHDAWLEWTSDARFLNDNSMSMQVRYSRNDGLVDGLYLIFTLLYRFSDTN
jgi:hypothetical protein